MLTRSNFEPFCSLARGRTNEVSIFKQMSSLFILLYLAATKKTHITSQ